MKNSIKIGIIFLLLILPFAAYSQGIGDLVFCFDISGSMRFPLIPGTTTGCSYIPPTGTSGTCSGLHPMSDPCIRYQKMLLAIRPTLQFLNTWYPQDLSGTAYDLFNSTARIAAVHFPDKNNNQPFAIPVNRQLKGSGNPFGQITYKYFPLDGADKLDTGQLLSNGIDVDCCQHGTPLGTALQAVLDQTLKPYDDHSATSDSQAVILISDGQPNRPPDPNDLLNSFWTQPGHADNPSYRRVYAIGIGDDDNHYEYLQILTKNTGGDFYGWWEGQTGAIYGPSASTTFDPSKPFGSGNFLWTNYLEKALFRVFLNYREMIDPVDSISSKGTNYNFYMVSPLDSSLIVTVKWQAIPQLQLDIKLQLPGGMELTTDTLSMPEGYFFTKGNYYAYFMVDKNLVNGKYDDWKIVVQADSLEKPVYYNWAVYSKSGLELESSIPQMEFSTDDMLTGALRINKQGYDVTIDSVNVYILQPQNWLGNWLADDDYQLSANELTFIRDKRWVEDLSLIDRKRMLLSSKQDVNYNRAYDLKRIKVALYDDGNHLDNLPNDGVYNNEFLRPTMPGIYEILYSVDGKTASGHTFHRELYFHKFVSLAVDTANSILEFKELKTIGDTTIAEVSMTFRDKHNNVALPENSKLITLDYDHAKAITAIDDQLNGNFIQQFKYYRRLGRPQVGLLYRNVIFPKKHILFTRVEHIPRFDIAIGYNTILFDDNIQLYDVDGVNASIGGYLKNRTKYGIAIGMAKLQDQSNKSGILLDADIGISYAFINKRLWKSSFSTKAKFLKTYKLTNNKQKPAFSFGTAIKFYKLLPLGIELEINDIVTSNFNSNGEAHNWQLRLNFSYNFMKKIKVLY